jgi:putative membrane-bound dehydrogenase-like protein
MKTSPWLAWLPAWLVLVLSGASPPAVAAELFDGRTLSGWEGDSKWWRVQDGALTGGSLTEKVPRNFFLATTRSYQNFDLTLKLKLTGVPKTGMINSGVQIRSLRVPNDTEMSGYQVDAGDGWWGKMYDESRRNQVIAESANLAEVNAAVKKEDWNEFRIRAEGPRIRSWINGVPALDYTEAEPNIAQDGHVAIQIHSGGMALVQVKDVRIEELPPTPGAPTWEKVGRPKPREPKQKSAPKKAAADPPAKAAGGRDLSYNAITDGPRTPDEQRRAFKLPPGFEIELVAAESEGIGKFIALAWDARMRLWTMTALEYPVDANENQRASDALFARGGRDKVVVFDDPYGAAGAAAPPRIFADGLVMPLGVQPYRDGAFVQYGADIRLYRDTNDDGRADRHDVVLTGFGTQDSHLFPHQFLRQPGGWMFVAQGLFNYSNVRRPGGLAFADGATEVPFNQCKLARFRLDGSAWENVTAGPNNIWGLVTGREGETFLQEANDMGYPVIPYSPGIHVRTGSRDRLRPYQPLMPPPLNPPQMGGTGLSGLALAEDGDGIFQRAAGVTGAGDKLFLLANPITGAVQRVKAADDGRRHRFEKLPDLLTSEDRWFRPVAVHFGPDGALYIVDWYNKIISHNEVPREHPDRDKARGRIWRVRHRDQPRVRPPDLAALPDRALLDQLGAPNALVARQAWLEIGDRRAAALAPDLARLAADRNAAADRRLGALWALESLQTVDTALLRGFAGAANPNLRREAARLAAAQPRPEAEFLALVQPLVADPHPAVRAAVGDALRRVNGAGPRVMLVAATLGRAPLADGDEWERYEGEFERYLARWAMEVNPAATLAMLESPDGRALPVENRLLASLALGGREAAVRVARLAPELTRALGGEELRALASHFAEPAVRSALSRALGDAGSRGAVLRALFELRSGFDPAPLREPLTEAVRAQLAAGSPADRALGAEVAGAFRLAAAEPELVALVRAHGLEAKHPVVRPALRALREIEAGPPALFEEIVRAPATEAAVRDEALATLAALTSPDAIARLVRLLPSLTTTQRGQAIQRLAGNRAGAAALVAGLDAGTVESADLGASTVDKLRTVLPGDARVDALWQRLGGNVARALRLDGASGDFASTQLELAGPFTVECWVKLDAPISNHDGLLFAAGQLDLNFHASRLRVWGGAGGRDLVVATKPAVPGVWAHYAVTRDAEGIFRIFINGELDATSAVPHTGNFSRLDVGRTTPTAGGTAGWLAEFRVWGEARSAREIRDGFDRTYAGVAPAARPAALRHVFAGAAWPTLQGNARVEVADDAPALLTEAEAAAQTEKFARFRSLANARGNPERGREFFTSLCLACHQQAGKGGQLAPALDGVGHSGVDALLRHLLTPSAAMESAYLTFRVVAKDGSVTEGFLVEQAADAVVLRQPGVEDRRFARAEIREARYLRRSLMPEGILEAMTPEQVTDLFAHLKSLR